MLINCAGGQGFLLKLYPKNLPKTNEPSIHSTSFSTPPWSTKRIIFGSLWQYRQQAYVINYINIAKQ
jgi:hypothetical protein